MSRVFQAFTERSLVVQLGVLVFACQLLAHALTIVVSGWRAELPDPAMAQLAAELVAAWPVRQPGFHLSLFDGGLVRLLLLFVLLLLLTFHVCDLLRCEGAVEAAGHSLTGQQHHRASPHAVDSATDAETDSHVVKLQIALYRTAHNEEQLYVMLVRLAR